MVRPALVAASTTVATGPSAVATMAAGRFADWMARSSVTAQVTPGRHAMTSTTGRPLLPVQQATREVLDLSTATSTPMTGGSRVARSSGAAADQTPGGMTASEV